MTSRTTKLLLALVVAVAGFALLFRLADLSQIDLRSISPKLAILPLLFLGTMIALRGALLRRIAPSKPDVARLDWLRLVAHHQLLFILAPSGLGDAGFFALARHHVGLDTAEAAATLALYRLRDAAMLASLGAAGGLMMAGLMPLAIAAAALAVLALYFAEDVVVLAEFVLRVLFAEGKVTRFLKHAASLSPTGGRLSTTLIVLALWTCSALATAAAFAAAGYQLSLQQTILMLAALNASGAIAISIGGLGAAEAGAAGMLMLFGETAANAAAVALVARPLLFLSAVAASVLLDLLSWWFLRFRPSARR